MQVSEGSMRRAVLPGWPSSRVRASPFYATVYDVPPRGILDKGRTRAAAGGRSQLRRSARQQQCARGEEFLKSFEEVMSEWTRASLYEEAGRILRGTEWFDNA